MKKLVSLMFFGVLLTSAACTQEVPPGYVGLRQEPSGIEQEVLQPGKHSCWGRCKMLLIETSETTYGEDMSVLCQDDLNFKFDLKVRARLRHSDGQNLVSVLNGQGSKMVEGVMGLKALYSNYVSPQARSIARYYVSQFSTTDIRNNRKEIEANINRDLRAVLEDSPVEVTMVVTSNFDYSEVITKAVEKKRQREIELQEEEAKQKMELLRADNRMKVAEKMKVVRAAEAEAEAAYNSILARSLTPNYLQMRRIEADLRLYEQVGAGDKVIVTNGQSGVLISP